MKASEIMTTGVVSTKPECPLSEVLQVMLDRRISGLPVVNTSGKLVGVITEGDCLRRVETGTEIKRPLWRELFAGPEKLAQEYIHAHGRKVSEVMTADPITITEDTDVSEIIHLMEKSRIKRLPVMRGDTVVGIVSRANIVRALAGLLRGAKVNETDTKIRDNIIAEFRKLPWPANELVDVKVKDGVVDLWGSFMAFRQDEAAVVAAENVAGVKEVRSHLSWVDPMSGMTIYSPDEEKPLAGARAQA
jgi:CBS domain-containing protein